MKKLQISLYLQPITTFDEKESISDLINWLDALTDEEKANIEFTVLNDSEKVKESYVEDAPGEYTIWSASDLVKPEDQIELVKIKVSDDGSLVAEPVGDSEFDKESVKIATNVITSAQKAGKSVKDTLTRIDKTLNHNDPFFSVEYDRNIVNNGIELLAAQALRTLRDDLKAVVYKKNVTEDDVVAKYTELTGVNYYTDEIVDKAQYNQILALLLKDPTDLSNYIYPKENAYIQKLKNLTEDLIEKVLLKNDPDFYNK